MKIKPRRAIGFHADPAPIGATEKLERIKERRDSEISAISYPIILGPEDLYFDYSDYRKQKAKGAAHDHDPNNSTV